MWDLMTENPTISEHSDAFGELAVTRLAPGDNRIEANFRTDQRQPLIDVEVTSLDGSDQYHQELPAGSCSLTVAGLKNGLDYVLKLVARHDGEIIARSPARLFRCGMIPGVVVNYIHPEDYAYMPSGRSTGSPSLLRLPDGKLLASHAVFWGNCAQNLSLVFRSDDRGRSWYFLSQVTPCFWGKLFFHHGKVYILGMRHEYGDLLIFESADGGTSWSVPAKILDGGNKLTGGPHKAPMPVISYQGRLWTCVDYGSWQVGGHANGFISIDEQADLMSGDNWVCTGFLDYDPSWPGTCRGPSEGCLEGNAVITPDGRLCNLLRYETRKCVPNYGKAILLEADPANPADRPRFYKVIDFPGNLSKFKVDYDPVTQKYYALVSRVTIDGLPQRNILSLSASEDLVCWKIQRDVLNYADNGWFEGVEKVGFQYADWLFDGDDLIFLSRTAINGAHNFHNANHLTFHRLANFRR